MDLRAQLRLLVSCLLLLAALVALPAEGSSPDRTPSPAAAGATGPGIPVSGQVLGAGDRALAGVRVELRPVVTTFDQLVGELEGRFLPAPVAATRTDADGEFRIEAPAAGFWSLDLSADGYLPYRLALQPLERETVTGPLHLPTAAAVEVRVLDPRGAPLAGALVVGEGEFVIRHPNIFNRAMSPLRRIGRTAEDGTVRLPRADGEELAVTVAVPGLAPHQVEDVEPGVVTVRLAPSRPRPVVVRDAGGQPVAGAVVLVAEAPWGVTGDDGRLAVPAPPPGAEALPVEVLASAGRRTRGSLEPAPEEHRASAAGDTRPAAGASVPAASPGDPAADDPAAEPPAAAGPPLEPLEVTLPAIARLSGRVLDPQREPIPGAWVWSNGMAAEAVHADERGRFTLDLPLPAGSDAGWLGADAPAYEADFQRLRPDQLSGSEPVTLLLTPVTGVAGRVVDADGEPVEGALLTAEEGRRSFRMGSGPHARSDAAGRFRFPELDAESTYELQARRPGYAPAGATVTTGAAGSVREGVEVVMRPGLRAFGRVVDLDEIAVAGAQVALRPVPEGGDFRAFMRASRDDSGVARGDSGPQGRFELDDLPPGRYNLEVRAAGFAPLLVPGLDLEAGADPLDLGTVLLEPGVALEGRVVDDAGQAVSDARVTARPEGGVFRRMDFQTEDEAVTTAADGYFRIPDLPRESSVHLNVKAEGFSFQELPGVQVPPPTPLVITLKPATYIAGEVVDEDGEPVASARVTVVGQQVGPGVSRRAFTGATTDPEGRFHVDDVQPGDVTVAVSARGFQSVERAGLRLDRGGSLEGLRIVLPRGATVQGRVLDTAGSPLPDASVRLLEEERQPGMGNFAFGRTDADGRYTMEGVPPGRQSFSAEHPDHLRSVRDLDVGRGANSLDFRLEAGTSLSGRVVDAGGEPVAGAAVAVGAGERGRRGFSSDETTSSEDGSFTVAGLEPGTYAVTARKQGYASALLEAVEVGPVPVRGVELRLERGAIIRGRLLGIELSELAGASVMAGAPGLGVLGNMGSVDFEGNYRVEGLSPGEWTVMANLGEGGRVAAEQVTLEEGQQEAVVDLDLGSGFTLSGQVFVGEEAVPELMVSVIRQEGLGGGYTRTDHLGGFRVQGLDEGSYRVRVEGFGIASAYEEDLELSGDQEMVIRVPVGSLSGRVSAVGEGPLEGAEVTVQATDGPSIGRTLPIRSGIGGEFALPALPAGRYRVEAAKDGYATASREIEVEAGTPTRDVELRLERAGGLTLLVRTTYGRSPERVRVGGYDPAQPLPAPGDPEAVQRGLRAAFGDRLPTGENGRVEVDEAPAGTWRVLVEAEGSAVVAVDAVSPGPPVPVVLPPGADLSVQVRDLIGTPQPATLRITGADGRPFLGLGWDGRVITDHPLGFGGTNVSGLPPGTWTVEVTAGDGRRWSGEAITTPGASTAVMLE